MKYNKQALIEGAQKAINARAVSWLEGKTRHDARQAQRLAEWSSQYQEAWRTAATVIRRKVGKGQPITAGDLPSHGTDRYQEVAFYRTASEYEPWQPTPDLVGAIARLESLDGDQVNTRQLAEVGIESDTLRKITPHMTPGSVSA